MVIASHQSKVNSHHDLYEQDFCLWVEKASSLLRAGRFDDLDMKNLLEEIEDMSNSQRRSLKSNLKILLMHLLKYKYQPAKRSNSWLYTVVEHRQRLSDALTSSPSLKGYFLEVFTEAYEAAKELASAETGLEIDVFPIDSPFTPEQVLDKKYLP
ncbi:protein of unknown function DUF29 [Synechococcus sp. PCC 7502]|uniref:DUF29 domain-containing protein n=1 Tax=Synechococcus sp. PCC 7502 TaxID=1173263 RepID=UPI00029FAB64|nr:DUF29 domain-containing protein [Synechococcus sp. PCC 7502]AFY74631.1 protein of unknown function DUF29 [Synechococcus sp. PCC 7502]